MKILHRKITIILILLISIGAQAQTSFTSYGGIYVKTDHSLGKYNPLIGGMGGVILNEKFGFGAFGNGKLGETLFENQGSISNENHALLNLKYGYGGLFVQYFLVNSKVIGLSIPVKFGYGAVGVYEQSSDNRIERNRMLVLEPEVHFDIKLFKNMAISMQAAYRFADVGDLDYVNNSQLSGWNLGLGLIFSSN